MKLYEFEYEFLDSQDGTHRYYAEVYERSEKSAIEKLIKRIKSYHKNLNPSIKLVKVIESNKKRTNVILALY